MSALLTLAGVHTHIGRYHILQGVDFTVPEAQTTMLLGRNGAGKTTTLRTIMGLWRASAGSIRLGDRGIEKDATPDISRAGLAYVPETMAVFSDLTVRENLDIGRQPPRRRPDGRAAPSWTPEKLFAIFPNLGAMLDRRGAHMSGGEQQMLTVARTLMGNPLLVMLDEPSEGVAPVIVEQMANAIVELKKEGLAVLLSEQNIHFAELVCDRVYVLEKGQLQWHGPMADLAGDVAAQRRLLSV